MRVTTKFSVIVLAAAAVFLPGASFGHVDADQTYSYPALSPYGGSKICPGGNCYLRPQVYYSYQPFDCNKAGTAAPMPVPARDLMVGLKGGFGTLELGSLKSAYKYGGGVKYDPFVATMLEARNRQRRPGSSGSSTATHGYADYFKSRIGLNFGPRPFSRRATTSHSGGKVAVYGAVQAEIGNFFPGDDAGGVDLKGLGADQGPVQGTSNDYGALERAIRDMFQDQVPGTSGTGLDLGTTNGVAAPSFRELYYSSVNVETPIGSFPETLGGYVNQQYNLGGITYSSLLLPQQYLGDAIIGLNDAGISNYFFNPCWQVLVPTDPNYLRTGRNGGNSWGVKEDDQWAIKRVGFTDDEESAWNQVPETAAPVVVAVIDTGLDWHHLDIDAGNIWRNAAEYPGNGVDDDNNGYVDDIIGWDFMGKHNRPWDFDGHGTVVTGVIAAAHNDVGIAGINPHVKIMVLKAVSNFGTTRPSFIAEAIVYAVDNGARVINISVGGPHASRMVQAAINYAHQEGVLVVAASGNDGAELDDYGPGGGDNVLTVGATYIDDRATAFSNYGDQVDLVAPGVDVLSLRARYTDANYRPDGTDHGEDEYVLGSNYVGDDKRYLHVSGTSFSTPIVAGIASLLISKNPELTADQVEQRLIATATDVEFPGKDKYTGYGLVNAQAALSVAADFSLTAEISSVELVTPEAPQFARVNGTIDASHFKRAWLQIGPGENPGEWRYVGPKRKFPIKNGVLATIPISNFSGSDLWQVVVNVEHQNGIVKRAAFPVTIP